MLIQVWTFEDCTAKYAEGLAAHGDYHMLSRTPGPPGLAIAAHHRRNVALHSIRPSSPNSLENGGRESRHTSRSRRFVGLLAVVPSEWQLIHGSWPCLNLHCICLCSLSRGRGRRRYLLSPGMLIFLVRAFINMGGAVVRYCSYQQIAEDDELRLLSAPVARFNILKDRLRSYIPYIPYIACSSRVCTPASSTLAGVEHCADDHH